MSSKRFLLAFLSVSAAMAETRPIRLDDIPGRARRWLGEHAGSPQAFDRWIQQLSTSTDSRLRQGQWDQLIHFILQSSDFTSLPRIDPVQSARHGREQTPPDVLARMNAFLAAGGHPLLDAEPGDKRAALEREYRRAMRFLYAKEIQARRLEGAGRRRYVAELYQDRGLSTDSSVASSFGVFVGLGIVKPKVTRALIIGPGLGPQPYLIADTLLRLGLSSPESIRIHCLDVNPQVIQVLNAFPGSLHLRWESKEDEHIEFFRLAGSSIGRVQAELASRRVEVSEALAKRITASRANIITERLTDQPPFDLAIATNVLLYFNDRELLLALANIRGMLKPGGYLLHNDLRDKIADYGPVLGLDLVHARMVRLDRTPARELYDGVIIHKVN